MRSKRLTEGCIALVLAAGRGRRFGSDKRLARLPSGQTLLAATLARVLEVFERVLVVLRAEDDPQRLGVDSRVRVVRAAQAENGMGSSLAAGIAALDEEGQAVAVLLGDMPWIEAATLRALAGEAHPGRIVLPVFQGERGHPVIFGRDFWPALAQVSADQGGRLVVDGNPHACLWVEVGDAGVSRDVDLPGDVGDP